MANFTYSAAGVKMTEQFEGLVLTSYQDQVGVWTIGYGHTGPSVHGGQTVALDQAEQLLESDLAAAATCVNRAGTGDIHQNQFSALVDFCFDPVCSPLLSPT